MTFPGFEPSDPQMIQAMRRQALRILPGLAHYYRYLRKRNSRSKKRHDIETRQVARAYILAGRAPTLIHNGKAAR